KGKNIAVLGETVTGVCATTMSKGRSGWLDEPRVRQAHTVPGGGHMSYQQQGYPQQQPQQPQMGGYQSGGYPAADSPSPVAAVIAGILGLVAAAALVVATVKFMSALRDLGDSVGRSIGFGD